MKKSGEFIGVRLPSDYAKFINVLAKMLNMSKQKAAIYLLQLGIELITDTPDLRNYNLEKMHREIKIFRKSYKSKGGGLSIDDGVRKNMHDIVKSHPCRKLMICDGNVIVM